jgi:hypothetical protein
VRLRAWALLRAQTSAIPENLDVFITSLHPHERDGSLMMKAYGFEKLQGHVEADEAYVSGDQSRSDTKRKRSNKTTIVG